MLRRKEMREKELQIEQKKKPHEIALWGVLAKKTENKMKETELQTQKKKIR